MIDVLGEEKLLYKSFPIDVAFIRGSYGDEYGNVTMHREVAEGEVTALAQAAKNTGGKVIVQVERIVEGGSLDPRMVKIPRIYVDALVISDPKDHQQTYDAMPCFIFYCQRTLIFFCLNKALWI